MGAHTMIFLPCGGHDCFSCKTLFDIPMDVASLVSPLTSNLGRLAAKHQCCVSPSAALSARHDSSSGYACSSAASLPYQIHDCSRNAGFSCGSSSHARCDDVLTTGYASQIEEHGALSESQASSHNHFCGLSSLEKTSGSGSEAQATKDTLRLKPSFYVRKPSLNYSFKGYSAGSIKSQQSLFPLPNVEENQHVGNNPVRQIPLSGSKAIMVDFSHIESDTITSETENAKVPSIQSSDHARVEDAKMRTKEDQGESMGLRMYARVENEGFESSCESHGSIYHAQDVCVSHGFLNCHELGSGHSSGDRPVSPHVQKEKNVAWKEPINDTDILSVVRLPVYRTSGGARLTESILYLDSMGVDSSRLIKEEPTTMTYDIKRLRELVRALESLGLQWKDLGKIFNLCPRIIHLCPVKDIKLVTNFLFDEVGLLPNYLSKVIKRCPRLLTCDVVGQLSPTLSFLRTLGFSNMGQVVANNATLLSWDVEQKLIPKLKYLESLGFSNREVVSMVNRFPALFNYNVKENLEPKYEYLVHEMGGSNKDLLAFPQYFGYSLEKRIIPRYRCIVKQDVSLSIQAMLKLSEAEFVARFHDVCDTVTPSKHEASDIELCDCALDSTKFQD